jgi:endonuclease G
MKIKYTVLLSVVMGMCYSATLWAQTSLKPKEKKQDFVSTVPFEYPVCDTNKIIKHKAYTLSYNEQHEQANWVVYELTQEKLVKVVDRSNRFTEDAKVITGTANNNDYKNSGYDKGHLAPAADMMWSEATMQESFLFSNMSPQVPAFNRGIWKNLEEQVRDWAKVYHQLFIAVGPVLENNLPTIGENKVSIPAYYYKIVVVHNDTLTQAIAFLMKNEASSLALTHYAVSIDSVEYLTQINFFPQLDHIPQVEASVCIPCWTWNSTAHKNEASPEIHYCEAITMKGERCKNQAKKNQKYCGLHLNE